MKSRKNKLIEYDIKYNNVPRDYQERLYWLTDILHISEKKSDEIINKYHRMINSLYYTEINIVLYEIPEGSPRPRARICRNNISAAAQSMPDFVRIYSITGASDNKYMKQLMNNEDFNYLDHIIYTPCDVEYISYLPTPSVYNSTDKMLAELGLIRPISKPDWDNIGKKYSDMSNSNLWLDDNLVIDGQVRKYYSVLPRIEIQLFYLNMLYNKHQYDSISKRYSGEINYFK